MNTKKLHNDMTQVKKYFVLGLLLMVGLTSLYALPTTRVVKGRVLDATTKTPLSGAMVRTAEEAKTARTN